MMHIPSLNFKRLRFFHVSLPVVIIFNSEVISYIFKEEFIYPESS